MKIYLLKCSIMSLRDQYEVHFENVYSKLEIAKQKGMEYLETKIKKYYNDSFDHGCPKGKELTKDELFDLSVIYDLEVIEFDPEITDKIDRLDYDFLATYTYQPSHIIYSYDYNGELLYIEAQYRKSNNKGHGINFVMKPSDFEKDAGTKFKVGDIVKIKQNRDKYFTNYEMENRLHVVISVPNKPEGKKYFENKYGVITNHNIYDNGCHKHCFREDELELINEKTIPKDSPILFLSKIYKGDIKISKDKMSDLICRKNRIK